MKKLIASALFLLLSPAYAADTTAPATIADALKQAAQQHRPVLVDFHAVWCYSCYYMASHVLNGSDWQAVERKAIVIEADADSPDGRQWMDKLKITALPSYVVLDEHGNEQGRILAEQPRQKFYPRINAILSGSDALEPLKDKAAHGSTDALIAALDVYKARNDSATGLAWYAQLPANVRTAASGNARAVTSLEQLHLAQAKIGKDNAAILASAQKVLAGDPGCSRPYVLLDLLHASEKLPDAQRRSVLATQRKATDAYLNTQIFTGIPSCADQRSAVIASADLDAANGDATAEKALLDRAIDTTRRALGDNLTSDRNLADNLRVYLLRAKRSDELDAYQRKLIAAYPDDYVYAYRYGRSLLESNRPEAALPWLAQAADKAYGVNRLTVTGYQVQALKTLHRQTDAEQLVTAVLKENGPWFPEQVAELKAELKS
jgi:thioredoxin-like negative regulator of GroEL